MSTPSPSIQEAPCALVYTARCWTNGKTYVGITSRSLAERVRKHETAVRGGSQLPFHKALRKHGSTAFTWEVRGQGLTWAVACEREQALVLELSTRVPEGYNVTAGGDGTLGMSLSGGSRAKISATLKAWHASDSPRALALRSKVSAVRKASKATLQTRLRLAGALRGRRLSDASRAKISASKLLYPEDLRTASVLLAREYGYRAVARLFGIPPITIRRWAKTPEEMNAERCRTLERNLARQYGYAFPTNTQTPDANTQTSDETQMKTTTT